jgi:hypothetical protein
VHPGCEFTFHPPSEGTTGTFDIGGPECTGINGAQLYHINILPQNGLAATFEKEGSGSSATVKIYAQATGLKYEVLDGPSKGTYSDGTYTTTWTMKGEHAGTPTGVSVVPYPGLSIVGEGESRKFHSDLYPVRISGEQVEGTIGEIKYSKNQITTGAGNILCSTVMFTSYPEEGVSEDTGELLLSPMYSSCTFGGLPATVALEPGCFDDFNVSGYFAENLGLCEMEIASKYCKATFLPQIRPGLTFVNVGTGSSSQVEVKANVSSLEYQLEALGGTPNCPNKLKNGSYSNGTYKGAIALKIDKVL